MGESVIAPGRPLVGRDHELARVEAALAQAAGGQGQIVFVVGHMGVGKTRLSEEALVLARRREFLVLVGRSPPAGSGLAYAPLLAAFGALLRSLEPPERDAMVGDLPHLGRFWPELGLPPPAPVGDPDLERALLFESVARLLERLAGDSPVVLFIDDIHWADGPSLALLGYLIPVLAALPILLIGTYRPEALSDNKGLRQFVTNARRSGIVAELALRGLDPEGVEALAAGILGDDPPASLLELSAGAAGIPLFVEALVRGLIEGGALVRTRDGWTMGEGPATLPREVQELVGDRLDLLAPDERSTVELIAHGAQGLPHDVLEHAGGLDSDQLVAVVRRLVGAGLLVQEDDGPEIVYRLAHPLIQQVAAADLPAVASRRLHARLARTVERLRPGDLDQLAYHYQRAGGEVDRDRALEVLLEAGERARSLAAHDEAARHYGAALPLIRDGQRPELLAEALERLGESWQPLGETAAATELWEEAIRELERAGDVRGVARLRHRLAFAAQATGDMAGVRRHLAAGISALEGLRPSDELFELHAARLLVDPPLAEPGRAGEAAAELVRLAEHVGSPKARVEALVTGVLVTFLGGAPAGDRPTVKAQAEEALRIAEQAGEWLLARRAHRELAWLALYDYDFPRIRLHGQAQVDIDRRLGDLAHEPAGLLILVYAAVVAGDFDEAVRIGEEAVALARRYEQPRALAMLLGQLAMARTYLGDLDVAQEHLAEADQVFPQLRTDPRARYVVGWPQATFALERGDLAGVLEAAGELTLPITRLLVGTAQVLAGDLEGAGATHALLAAGEAPGSCAVAFADRLRALIEQARGDADTARRHLERSAVALDALGLAFEAAISRLHAGTVDSVRQALATFEAVGAARYTDKARRALRALGVRLSSPRSGRRTDQVLSRRELEVAGLVAEGLSNAEIAGRLVLSVRTVETHLAHIYGRLGISSRTALAAWLTAAGPSERIT